MKERPILFGSTMVRAILAGEKTQTRRLVATGFPPDGVRLLAQPSAKGIATFRTNRDSAPNYDFKVECPFGGVGGPMWVRETWRQGSDGIIYRADMPPDKDPHAERAAWRPSIYLTRAACRITLEIAELRVQRLQGPRLRAGSACAGADHPDRGRHRARVPELTMDQPEFDFNAKRYPEVPGYKKGSRTSYNAARAIAHKAPGKRVLVLADIKNQGLHGATMDEIVVRTGMLTQTVSGRLTELRLGNLIFDSGQTRPTRNAHEATVWLAVQAPPA